MSAVGWLDESRLPGPAGDLDSVTDAEFVVDAGQVGLDGAERDEQVGGDFGVGAAFGDGPDDFDLSLR